MVLGGTGHQRGRIHLTPILMTGLVVGGEKMSALAARHLKKAGLFVAGRDHQAFGGPKGRSLDPGHVVVAWKEPGFGVEPA